MDDDLRHETDEEIRLWLRGVLERVDPDDVETSLGELDALLGDRNRLWRAVIAHKSETAILLLQARDPLRVLRREVVDQVLLRQSALVDLVASLAASFEAALSAKAAASLGPRVLREIGHFQERGIIGPASRAVHKDEHLRMVVAVAGEDECFITSRTGIRHELVSLDWFDDTMRSWAVQEFTDLIGPIGPGSVVGFVSKPHGPDGPKRVANDILSGFPRTPAYYIDVQHALADPRITDWSLRGSTTRPTEGVWLSDTYTRDIMGEVVELGVQHDITEWRGVALYGAEPPTETHDVREIFSRDQVTNFAEGVRRKQGRKTFKSGRVTDPDMDSDTGDSASNAGDQLEERLQADDGTGLPLPSGADPEEWNQLLREQARFVEMFDDLMAGEYRGQWVAIRHGEVVDADPHIQDLAGRMYDTYQGRGVYFDFVGYLGGPGRRR